MEDSETVLQLDPNVFTLTAYDPVKIFMPPLPLADEEDINAQLFQYVASADKDSGIVSIADIDDEWVQNTIDGYDSLEDLRSAIRQDLEKNSKRVWDNLKFQKCSDALIERLEGVIPQPTINANIEASRMSYDERLRCFGLTKAQYLREEGLTESQFEQKLSDDVLFQLRLNMVLDKLIETANIEIAKSELTEYLFCENPATFIAEIEKNNQVEEARNAAARVKIMRRVIETAVIEEENDTRG